MQSRFPRKNIVFFLVVVFCSLLLNIHSIYGLPISAEAQSYREKGYEAQERGDIDTAISWYQKAAEFDKNYAAPHNDLGILYETKSWLDKAEEEYKKALAIDHKYATAHTNLALLYERKGELEKAAFHWMRRYKFGKPDERWTQEARERLERLGLVDASEIEKPASASSHKFLQETLGTVPSDPHYQESKSRGTRESSKEEPKTITKDEAEEETERWTRLGSKPKEKIPEEQKKTKKGKEPEEVAKNLNAKKEALDKELQKELEKSIRLEQERALKEKPQKIVAKKIDKKTIEPKKPEEAKKRDAVSRSFPTPRPEESPPLCFAKRSSGDDEGSRLDKKLRESLNLAWERLRKEKAEEKVEEKEDLDLNKEIQKTLETEEQKLLKQETEKKESYYKELEESLSVAEKSLATQQIANAPKTENEEEVQKILRVVDERFQKEKSRKQDSGKLNGKGKIVNAGSRNYYVDANNFYRKGEYSKALDSIRIAKNKYPDEPALLELEGDVKNKMKEERLNDHYSQGMMFYEQKDFSSAKKEFEAILNILPE